MSELESQIELFIQQAQNAYQEKSIIQDLSQWTEYKDESHKGLDFVQVGRLTSIPKRIFAESREKIGYKTLAENFTEPIWIGEQIAIIEEIDDVASDSNRSTEIARLTYDELVKAYRESNADHIYLPITESYWNTVHEWYNEDKGGYRDDSEYISLGPSELEVHWLPTDRGIESVYLLDSAGLSVIQKRGKHTQTPDQVAENALESINELSDEHHLMCYFADQGSDQLDVLQRVLLWMDLESDAAFRIDPEDTEGE